MVYGRRISSNKRPIMSTKHEVVWSNLLQDASGVQKILLVEAVRPNVKDLAPEVDIGASVNGIYLEFQFSPEAATTTTIIHWQVAWLRIGQTESVPSAYFTTDRSQILKRGMEMLPKDVSTIIKRIIFVPIPKGIRRQKENMQIFFKYIATSAQTINACGFAIYKEYM